MQTKHVLMHLNDHLIVVLQYLKLLVVYNYSTLDHT
jgi:hypothetical protein